MWFSRLMLKMMGWKVDITVPDYPKVIICVAPHTSNWDFIIGKLAYASIGRKAGFLMKEGWFFFPLGLIFKAIGGIPVSRRKGSALTSVLVDKFNSSERMALAITPEGTRKRVCRWRTGFLHIALDAHVPIVLGVIDFATKRVIISTEYIPTGNIEKDIREIKKYYRHYQGKYPDKFCSDDSSE